MGIETERHLELTCALGPDKLLVRTFVGSEYLGRCFEYTLMLLSTDHDIKLESLLGTHATVRVRTAQTERYFDGVVFEFGHVGSRGRYASYKMTLRPWLWTLAQHSDCRVYQKKTALEIVKDIIKEHGLGDIEEKLEDLGEIKKREYCVQYRESHLAFISRLLESEGIYYYFTHEKQKHKMVLINAASKHEPAPGFEKLSLNRLESTDKEPGVFWNWAVTNRVQPGFVVLNDYDFEKPPADIKTNASDPKPHQYADGEWFDYPGTYVEVKEGNVYAKLRNQEHMSNYAISEGETDAVGLFTGCAVTLADHPRKDQNKKWTVIGASYTVESGGFESGDGGGQLIYQARVKVIDSSVQFRPARVTRTPIIAGAQTATVVGPKGQEIATDEYGRIKVQFHWDRRGKRDENSSCFIRVAQNWAGPKWGSIFIPRIGQEVIVDFLEGDPDQPLVTGCVYNASNPVPYKLTDKQTQSGIKTHSTKGGGPDDYNELRFEDKKGEEELHIQAQKDFTSKTKHDSTHEIKNKLSITVDDSTYDTLVKKGKMTTKVPMNTFEVDAKKIYLHVGENSITIDMSMIEIKYGTNKIVLSPAGVVVQGLPIKLN